MTTLEDAFRLYFWDRGDYDANMARLIAVQDRVRSAISKERNPDAAQEAIDAVDRVLSWGSGGTGTKLYSMNMRWAQECGADLPNRLRRGRAILKADVPDLAEFGRRDGPRMNAGFTKYYALACEDVIIYDGRVGAALCYLVRLHLSGHPEVPRELAFRWGKQNSTNPITARHRDPSSGLLRFCSLGADGKRWAQCNVMANWILHAALARSEAGWCHSPDGMRRVEAALFMLGYELPQA